MAIWILKVVCLFVVFLMAAFFGLLPIVVLRWLRNRERHADGLNAVNNTSSSSRTSTYSVLSHLNCFSGGVFLATFFIHLFPEVIEKYAAVMQKAGLSVSYPLPELLISLGFFLILIVEQSVAVWKASRRAGRAPSANSEHADPRQPLIEGASEVPSYQNDWIPPTEYEAGEVPAFVRASNQRVQHDPEGLRGIRAVILLLALSAHAFFAGLAIGLETDVHTLWMLLAAVVVHKSIIAFSVGLQFADAFRQISKPVVFMLIFSVTSPLGISIGTTITAVDNETVALDIASVILQGLATGTFLYVMFFEILHKELGASHYGISKVFFVLIGFSIISLSKLFEK